MKIHYAILHWNRPYFADVHYDLCKSYFPFVDKIFLLDDGSEQKCFELLKNKFDYTIRSKTNVNGWKNGSAGDLIVDFLESSDADIVIFAEDDFLPCPITTDDSSTEEFMIPPDIILPDKNQFEFSHAFKIALAGNNYINMAKSSYGWKKLNTSPGPHNLLYVKKESDKRSYSNWPWMMNRNFAKEIFKNVRNLPIWQIESKVDESMRSVSHKVMCLKTRQHIHAGFICSSRIDDFEKIGKFNFNRRRSASKFIGKKVTSLDALRAQFMNSYLEGYRISDMIMKKEGLYSALNSFINQQ